jgi:hypothetical protein
MTIAVRGRTANVAQVWIWHAKMPNLVQHARVE